MNTEYFMKQAIREAKKAEAGGDVPVGAVIVSNGKIVARAYNRREKDNDATAHAEVLAIKKAAKKLGRWNLSDCDLFVTLEPCVMCTGAVVNARISTVFFGAYDRRFGCCGSLCNLANGAGFNHNAELSGGILEKECSGMLSDFFARVRAEKKSE